MTTSRRALFKAIAAISAIGSLAALIYLLSLPGDAENAWLLGFSRSRAVLIGGFTLLSLLLIWLVIRVFRNARWTGKIESDLTRFLSHPVTGWIVLVVSTLALTIAGWLIAQWGFTATDEQLRAYLERLTPPISFGILVLIQILILLWVFHFSIDVRKRWQFILTMLGGIVLFQWLFAGEFYLADRLFPEYFVAERYGAILQGWLPWILLQTALLVQLPFLLRKPLRLKIDYAWVFLAIAIILAYFYVSASLVHAKTVNTDLSMGDQDVYVDFIRKVSQSGFSYTGTRNQTPGYPFLMALFCRGNMQDQALFLCGKQANIYLSLALLIILFWFFRLYFDLHPAFTLTLVIAFSIFIFKAPYLKAELVYYFASFICFVLMGRMLVKPAIGLGVLTGIALGLTHLIKASILPGLALFIVLFLVREIWQRSQTAGDSGSTDSTWRRLVSLGLLLLVFLAVIFPYLLESKRIYGRFFYNVNTSYYIWYDSWEQAREAGIRHGFETGVPDLPPNQLPGLRRYVQSHSMGQISARLANGLQQQALHLWDQNGVFNYLVFYLLILGITTAIHIRDVKSLLRRHGLIVVFVILYALGYTILFAWYFPIAGGPRFISGLFIPLLFSAWIGIRRLTDGKSIRLGRREVSQSHIFEWTNAAVIALLAFDAYITITQILPAGYFGS